MEDEKDMKRTKPSKPPSYVDSHKGIVSNNVQKAINNLAILFFSFFHIIEFVDILPKYEQKFVDIEILNLSTEVATKEGECLPKMPEFNPTKKNFSSKRDQLRAKYNLDGPSPSAPDQNTPKKVEKEPELELDQADKSSSVEELEALEPSQITTETKKNESSAYKDSEDWLSQLAMSRGESRDRTMSSPHIQHILNKPRTMSSPHLSESREHPEQKNCFDSLWRCRNVDSQSKSVTDCK